MAAFLVASLSLVPGLGHLVVGNRGRAFALFAADLGIVCSFFIFRSAAGHLLVCLGYLLVMVPAFIELYALSHGGVSQFSESKPYILALLLVTGFAALPLLWQSPVFSRRVKIGWSIAVPVLAVINFGFLSFFGMRFLGYVRA